MTRKLTQFEKRAVARCFRAADNALAAGLLAAVGHKAVHVNPETDRVEASVAVLPLNPVPFVIFKIGKFGQFEKAEP